MIRKTLRMKLVKTEEEGTDQIVDIDQFKLVNKDMSKSKNEAKLMAQTVIKT